MSSATLHHRITGPQDAPVLLMGGSLGANLKMWDGQLPLGEHLRLVRFDHRGHGGSPAPPGPYELSDLGRDVIELMDTLEISRASYCGLSMGGMVGMWLAENAPERVERLVLLCTASHMPPPQAWQDRAEAVLGAGSTEPIADAVVDRWLTPDFADAHPEVRADLRAMITATRADAYAWCCGALAEMDLREGLKRISAPTLVVSGSHDPSTPIELQEAIASAIPDADHVVIAPAAHLVAVERPERVNELILEHLS